MNQAMRYLGCTLMVCVATVSAQGAEQKEPGVMLREGNWHTVGAYEVPPNLAGIQPAQWPTNGWFRLDIGTDRIQVDAEPHAVGKMPAFLSTIISQLNNSTADFSTTSTLPETTRNNGIQPNRMYLRVPDLSLPKATVPVYLFKNGTSRLSPKLDYRYNLQLGGEVFSVTVQNGLRGKNGAAYGDGAEYTIEYGGHIYRYHLSGAGWDSSIKAIADIDGDGKPDFIIDMNGGEYILLSSKAIPGRNPATASLFSGGC